MIDRLHIGYVGAYGNSWIETPSFDRLAAESFLFDRYWIDSPDLKRLYRTFWQGRHALEPPIGLNPTNSENPETRLPALLSAAGVATTLVSDEPEVLKHPLAREFGDRIRLSPSDVDKLADSWEEGHLARSFAQFLQCLDETKAPSLLWCHLNGLGTAWDAPYEFRSRYAADEDPPPPTSPLVPSLQLPEDYDPDELVGITQCYAGQVTLLDHCLAALLEWLETSPQGQETLLLLASSRGFPLGEHLMVGDFGAVYGELAHVPLLMRLPDREGAAARSQALAEPADIWATLLDWWGCAHEPLSYRGRSLLPLVRGEVSERRSENGDRHPTSCATTRSDTQHPGASPRFRIATELRDRLCIAGAEGRRGIVTPAWFAQFTEAGCKLYAKPDDRWEFNDVADRCPQVVELLEQALQDCERRLSGASDEEPAPLEDVLVTGLD